jgi:hypothetical protein
VDWKWLAGTNRIFGEYEGGMLETTEAERDTYIASVPPEIIPTAPGIVGVIAYYQKLVVILSRPANILPQSPVSYTVTVSPGGFTASGSESPIIVSGITNGVTYSVSVVATTTGGTSPASILESVDSSYSPTVFTTVGTTTWTAPTYVTSVEYLVVGGGGGGGGGHDTGGGGGGGGGMVLTGSISITAGSVYNIQVGSGGAASTNNYPTIRETNGGVGGNSLFSEIVALGGSGGLQSRSQTGGSGFRGSAQVFAISAATGGSGGGNAGTSAGGSGGGGGGAGGNGTNGTAGSGGSGGIGINSSLSGSSNTYGIGGSGARGDTIATGANATANTGNGGGGGVGKNPSNARNGGAGGSGIVILRY